LAWRLRAAAGEEIVIGKNRVPRARPVPIRRLTERCESVTALRITFRATDFDASDARIKQMCCRDLP